MDPKPSYTLLGVMDISVGSQQALEHLERSESERERERERGRERERARAGERERKRVR